METVSFIIFILFLFYLFRFKNVFLNMFKGKPKFNMDDILNNEEYKIKGRYSNKL